MNEFYTNVSVRGNYILSRGVKENGEKFQRKEEYSPTLFVPSQKESKYKTLDGYYVEPIKPGTISDTRDFLRKYDGVQGFDIYGNTDYVYQYIFDTFQGEVDYDFSQVKVANIDIETESEYGFPKPDDPKERINAITVDFNGWIYVFGLGEFNLAESPYDGKLRQFSFETEEELLLCFLDTWDLESPDIVTGWNVRFFEIPYLVNRIGAVLGAKEVKRLSPWKIIKEKSVRKMNRENQTFDLVGVSTLDYYEL